MATLVEEASNGSLNRVEEQRRAIPYASLYLLSKRSGIKKAR
jgi:hypothetical protein